MAMVLACASMLFSTNSAMALSGLLCESAMIRIAFQSSPIRNLPLSDFFDLAALVFATVTRNSTGRVQEREGPPASACPLTISDDRPQPVISHSLYRGPLAAGKASSADGNPGFTFRAEQFVGSDGLGVFPGPVVGDIGRNTDGRA